MSAIPRELLAVVALVACVALALFVGTAEVRRWLRRLLVRKRAHRASAGERNAALLLAREGYAVEEFQACTEYEVTVDGAPVTIALRADYMVTREGRRFVAEVKTGSAAPRIDTPATRRQLLEYETAFNVDGVLLVDAERERIHEVAFVRRERARVPVNGWLWFALFAAGALFVLAR